MLLALDTSTPLVSVALYAGGAVVSTAVSDQPMKHGEMLAPLITRVLADAGADRLDLTGVAVGLGPGPFTGLRVGVVTARTLGFALDIPVHGVCSLDVLAAQAVDSGVDGPFVATLDARRKELFWASYDAAGGRTDGPHVGRPDSLPQGVLVVGAGPRLYPEAFARTAEPVAPDAGVMARLVAEGTLEPVDPDPIYLRRPDATVPGPAKKVT